jgi:glycosyltransferase involved in cell wall biosynthesis
MTSSVNKELFMVVPCFNEEKRIKLNYWNDLAVVPNVNWIFVNDGSTDDTKNVLNKITNSTIINLGKQKLLEKELPKHTRKIQESHSG